MSGSETMLRELFRGLETTIHERLNLIEQVIRASEKPKVPLYDNEFIRRIERLEEMVASQELQHPEENNLLEQRITALEDTLTEVMGRLDALRLAPAPMQAHTQAHTQAHEEPEVIETNIVVDEEDDVVVVEEEEQEEEEEEEEMELEELEWQGVTYAKDPENQVYSLDDEGSVDPNPVGKWNGRKIIFYKH